MTLPTSITGYNVAQGMPFGFPQVTREQGSTVQQSLEENNPKRLPPLNFSQLPIASEKAQTSSRTASREESNALIGIQAALIGIQAALIGTQAAKIGIQAAEIERLNARLESFQQAIAELTDEIRSKDELIKSRNNPWHR